MRIFSLPIIISGARTSRWALLVVVLIGLGICGYLVGITWKPSFEFFQKLPAGILAPLTEEPEEELITEESITEFLKTREAEVEKYIEVAGEGEGITHLARKSLKEYLQKNPQDFEVTPEHKIYVEDYIAKKIGNRWLELGEQLEISDNLIKEALAKSAELSPEQLENLTQYSQLVPFLDY